jgi:prepilin-type N-terminal cleavage/methylation domain-containing protein
MTPAQSGCGRCGRQRPRGPIHHASEKGRSGFTLLELAFAITILVIGLAGISTAMLGAARAGTRARETDRATQAAKAMLERIQAEAFPQAFRSFNGDASDDPSGAGTAPGANFAVTGLRPAPGDTDGMPGEIEFPTPTATSNELRENVNNPELGMPRDLNGDGAIDGNNHATDYKLLPVRVRVHWQGADGATCNVTLKTMLANY